MQGNELSVTRADLRVTFLVSTPGQYLCRSGVNQVSGSNRVRKPWQIVDQPLQQYFKLVSLSIAVCYGQVKRVGHLQVIQQAFRYLLVSA